MAHLYEHRTPAGKYLNKEFHIADILDDKSEYFRVNNNFGTWLQALSTALHWKTYPKVKVSFKIKFKTRERFASFIALQIFKIFLREMMKDIVDNCASFVFPAPKQPVLSITKYDRSYHQNYHYNTVTGGDDYLFSIEYKKRSEKYIDLVPTKAKMSLRWYKRYKEHIKNGRQYG